MLVGVSDNDKCASVSDTMVFVCMSVWVCTRMVFVWHNGICVYVSVSVYVVQSSVRHLGIHGRGSQSMHVLPWARHGARDGGANEWGHQRYVNMVLLSNRLLELGKGLTEWSEWRVRISNPMYVWATRSQCLISKVVSAPADYSADWGHEKQSHKVPDSCWLHQDIGGLKGWQGEGLVWLFWLAGSAGAAIHKTRTKATNTSGLRPHTPVRGMERGS
jgi:hypothetical protein